MQLNQNWERLFAPAILTRGYDYYLDDCVIDLRACKDGWTACVCGSSDYNVFVPSAENGAAEPHCDCPHFADGNLCKHLAATCFEIEHQSQDEPADVDLAQDSKASRGQAQCARKKKPTLEETVASVAEADLRTFLLAALHDDEALCRRFMGQFTHPDAAQAKRGLACDIDQAIRAFSHRGFIDYRSAFPFEDELHILIDGRIGPLLGHRMFDQVFQLTTVVLLRLQNVLIDDSDGFFTSMMMQCEGYWQRIMTDADSSTKQRAFTWLANFSQANPGKDKAEIYWFQQERVQDFLIDTFSDDRDYTPYIQDMADKAIAECKAYLERSDDNTPVFRCGFTQRLERWVLVRLRTMQALDSDGASLRAYAGPFMECHDVRAFFVERALEREDVNEAIRLLEEGAGQEGARYSASDAELLLKMYRQVGNQARVTQQLFDLAVHDATPYEGHGEKWLEQLRGRYGSAEWPGVREQVLAAVGEGTAQRSYLAAEGLTERLKQSIEQLDGYRRFAAVQGHRAVLETAYPAWMLEEYRQEVERQLERTTGRDVYRSAVRLMLRMQDIPGGNAVVDELAASLKTRYPRRRALMEELEAVR